MSCYTAQGYSDYIYEGATDWLVRETWHSSISNAVFDLVRYWYTNGRPSRVEVANVAPDLSSVSSYTPYYLQYNWHGDVRTWVAAGGNWTGQSYGVSELSSNALDTYKYL